MVRVGLKVKDTSQDILAQHPEAYPRLSGCARLLWGTRKYACSPGLCHT
ncbi:hypothetical protein HMPREF0742_01244 [Rothia aeria F0184]|uniref:Uncharacterized protein n=1 Tax=Rothia aeria F0184 TaxID=888019 RepID=U7V3D6_9MICC|nr:hypothetical protein HMPREF0742_01244 [Rothia aeria F0184]